MNPELAALEQFYLRTRADVEAKRLPLQEGLDRIRRNIAVDASGVRWAVDPSKSSPSTAVFVRIDAGGRATVADPSEFRAASGDDGGILDDSSERSRGRKSGRSSSRRERSRPSKERLPREKPQRGERMKKDRSSRQDRSGSPVAALLEKVKNLPKWAFIAAAAALVALVVVVFRGGGSTPTPPPVTASSTSVPAPTLPPASTDPTTPDTETDPPATTAAPDDPTTSSTAPSSESTTTLPTTPTTSAALQPLTMATVNDLANRLLSGDLVVAQSALSAPISIEEYEPFAELSALGAEYLAIAPPLSTAGAPFSSTQLQLRDVDGAALGSPVTALFVRGQDGEWRLRNLPPTP